MKTFLVRFRRVVMTCPKSYTFREREIQNNNDNVVQCSYGEFRSLDKSTDIVALKKIGM